MHERTALVTGSGSGIGLAIARALARSGYSVMIHGLEPKKRLEELHSELEHVSKRRCALATHNLANPSAARALVAEATKMLGAIDVLVNNAGLQKTALIEDFTEADWNLVIAVNLTAAFHSTAAALPAMKAKGWGRVLNVASAHGLVASPMKSAYVASKHGLIGFTKSAALECAGSGVTCNAICPGWVKTPLVEVQIKARAAEHSIPIERAERELLLEKQPSGRFVEADEIAATVVFLASDAAASITGASISIDGGWTAR